MKKILVLTDSGTHGNSESIYALLTELESAYPELNVWVVDRANVKNKRFFSHFNVACVWARRVDDDFKYSPSLVWFEQSEYVDLAAFDVFFLRLDRPFSDQQLRCLESNFPNILFINNPSGIIQTGSKEYLLHFPQLCPTMTLCESYADVVRFSNEYDAVLKPLHGYGGEGIFKITQNTGYCGADAMGREQALLAIQHCLDKGERYLAMEYMRNVDQGDKRIVVVGESVLGATLRLPAKDGWLCNLKQGGSDHPANVDDDELHIAETIIPQLIDSGILVFGFDTLVNNNGKRVLSEINTLNVGGLIQVQKHSGKPTIATAAKEINHYIMQH